MLRKKSEIDIKKQNNELEEIISAVADLSIQINSECKIVNIWTKNEDLLIFPKKEIIGKTFIHIFKEKGLIFEQSIKNVLDTSKSTFIEYDLDLKQGKRFFKAKILKINETNVITLINDITESKLYENEIKKREALIEPIINSTDDLIFSVDNKFNITAFNKSFKDRMKLFYNKDITTGTNLLSIPFFDKFKSQSFDDYIKDLSIGLKINNEICIFHDNKNYYYSNSINPIIFDNNIIGVSIFSKDITIIKETEIELRKQKEKFEKLLDKLPIGIFQKDKSDNYTYVNRLALKHISKDFKEIIGKNSIETFKDEIGLIFKESDQSLRNGKEFLALNEIVLPRGNDSYTYLIGKILLDYQDPINSDIIGFSIDITDKKHTELKLIKQKERFENVLDKLPIGVFEVDKNGKFTFVNSTMTNLSSKNKTDFIGKSIYDIYDKNTAMEGDYYNKILRVTKKPLFYEKEIIKDSNKYFYYIGKFLTNNDDPENSNILGYSIDITEEKKASIELRKQKDKFEKLLEKLPFGIFEKDKYGKFTYVNITGANYIGKSKFEIIGKKSEEIFNYQPTLGKSFEDGDLVLRKSKTGFDVREDIKYIEGSPYYYLTGKVLIDKEDPENSDIIGYSLDITKTRLAEQEVVKQKEALKLQKEKFENVLNSLPIAIFEKNIEGKYTFVNSEFSKLRNIEKEDFLDKKVHEIFDEITAQNLEFTDNFVFETGNKHSVEKQFHVNGEIRDFLVEKNISKTSSNEKTLIGYALDITEKKKAEINILKAIETAKKATLAKSEFLSIMSHEIRTPINAVIGVTNLLVDSDPREDQLENLKILKFSSENLLLLINDILDFNKIEAGKVHLEKIEFSLKELINKVKDIFQNKACDKNINLITNISEDVPDKIEGDPTRIIQIINNLVSNAIKFTEYGHIKVTCTLKSKIKDFVEIYFSVEDTGIGISKDRLDSIFELFTQENSSTTRKYGGTGLGLNIVKSLLNLHGSEIKLESEKNKGSTFSFTLKLKYIDTKESLTTLEKVKTEKDLKGAHILIVEDNKINAIVAKQFLKKWNSFCDIAEDGLQALEFLKENDTDLILMDLQMPNMDGIEATKQIRISPNKKYNNVPIIVLTAAATMDMLEKAYEVGVNSYIIKPFNPENLYSQIHELLEKNKF